MRKQFLLTAAVALVARGAWAGTATLNPSKDNTMWNDTPTELSNGQGPYLFVGANSGLSVRRALMAFDLPSAVPTNAIVTSASLIMNVSKGHFSTNVELHKLTKNWGEGASDAGDPGGGGVPAQPGDATWIHNFYNTSTWTTPGGDFSLATSATTGLGVGSGEFTNAPMVSDIQGWMTTPATNFGWLLKGDEATAFSALRLDSLQNPTPENRPLLTVGYNASAWKTTSGVWSGPGNWNFGIPGGIGAEANFSFQSGPPFNGITITVDGNKTLGTINFASSNPYNLSGSAITLDRANGATNINVTQGSHQISTALNLNRNTKIDIAAGSSLTFAGAVTAASTVEIHKLGEGRIRLGNVRADTLNIVGGNVIIAPNGGNTGVSYVNALSIDPSAALDLNDNDLVVNTGDFTDIQSLVFSGYRTSLDTAATGIISTTGQNAGGTTILALFNNALFGVTDYPFGSGHSIAAGAIVGKYTFIGDTDWDGQVTPQDYTAIDANLGATGIDLGASWFSGDTNFDGNIDPSDYTGVDAALGLGAGNPLAANSIPEPAAIALLGLGALALARRGGFSRRFLTLPGT